MGCDEEDSVITDPDMYNFVQNIKNLHDELRKKHNSNSLNYKNTDLNALAKTYAKELN